MAAGTFAEPDCSALTSGWAVSNAGVVTALSVALEEPLGFGFCRPDAAMASPSTVIVLGLPHGRVIGLATGLGLPASGTALVYMAASCPEVPQRLAIFWKRWADNDVRPLRVTRSVVMMI
ncbi:hypothetical protein MRX96_036961 [Rhipicephalus microplus]